MSTKFPVDSITFLAHQGCGTFPSLDALSTFKILLQCGKGLAEHLNLRLRPDRLLETFKAVVVFFPNHERFSHIYLLIYLGIYFVNYVTDEKFHY